MKGVAVPEELHRRGPRAGAVQVHLGGRTTQGNIKNTGRVSFIEQGEGFYLDPTGTSTWLHPGCARSGFAAFATTSAASVQNSPPLRGLGADAHQDELDEDGEGSLGTFEGGEITQSHEEYVEEHEEELKCRGDSDESEDEGEEEPEGEGEEEPEGEGEEESLRARARKSLRARARVRKSLRARARRSLRARRSRGRGRGRAKGRGRGGA